MSGACAAAHRTLLLGTGLFSLPVVVPGPRSLTEGVAIQGALCERMRMDMLSSMRTTIDINDELLRAVKAHAVGERKTLQATVEEALREFLVGPRKGNADASRIPVFAGWGVQPGVDLTDNAALEAILDSKS